MAGKKGSGGKVGRSGRKAGLPTKVIRVPVNPDGSNDYEKLVCLRCLVQLYQDELNSTQYNSRFHRLKKLIDEATFLGLL
jgi:hypothetical protein